MAEQNVEIITDKYFEITKSNENDLLLLRLNKHQNYRAIDDVCSRMRLYKGDIPELIKTLQDYQDSHEDNSKKEEPTKSDKITLEERVSELEERLNHDEKPEEIVERYIEDCLIDISTRLDAIESTTTVEFELGEQNRPVRPQPKVGTKEGGGTTKF